MRRRSFFFVSTICGLASSPSSRAASGMRSASATRASAGREGVMRKFSTLESQLRVWSGGRGHLLQAQPEIEPALFDALGQLDEVHGGGESGVSLKSHIIACQATLAVASIATSMKPFASDLSSPLPRRDFIAGAAALGAAVLAEPLRAQSAPRDAVLGPVLGHADETSAMVWLRAAAEGEFALEVTPETGGVPQLLKQTAAVKDDLCVHWRVTGLKPGTRYRYRILRDGKEIAADAGPGFRSPRPMPRAPAKVRLAISSCAKEDEGSRAVWDRMAAEERGRRRPDRRHALHRQHRTRQADAAASRVCRRAGVSGAAEVAAVLVDLG